MHCVASDDIGLLHARSFRKATISCRLDLRCHTTILVVVLANVVL